MLREIASIRIEAPCTAVVSETRRAGPSFVAVSSAADELRRGSVGGAWRSLSFNGMEFRAIGSCQLPNGVLALEFVHRQAAPLILGALTDGCLAIWDLATAHLIKSWSAHAGEAVSVSLQPGVGRAAVSCGWDGTCRLWDVALGHLLADLRGLPQDTVFGRERGASWSPHGDAFALATNSASCLVYELRTNTPIARLNARSPAVSCGWSQDLYTLAVAGRDGLVIAFDIRMGDRPVTAFREEGTKQVHWHRDAILTCGDSSLVSSWRRPIALGNRFMKVAQMDTGEAPVQSLSSVDSTTFVSVCRGGLMQAWPLISARS